MFAKGIQLSLLIGPIVPIPAPRVVLDALESVEVRTATGAASGFQLKFSITARSELNTIFLLAAGVMAPERRKLWFGLAVVSVALVILSTTLVIVAIPERPLLVRM